MIIFFEYAANVLEISDEFFNICDERFSNTRLHFTKCGEYFLNTWQHILNMQ